MNNLHLDVQFSFGLFIRASPKAARGNHQVPVLAPPPIGPSCFLFIIKEDIEYLIGYSRYLIVLCNECLIFLMRETLRDVEGLIERFLVRSLLFSFC